MHNIVSINFTTATPKRVLLLCQFLAEYGEIHSVNWERDPESPSPSENVIQTGSVFRFLLSVWSILRKSAYDIILFDDFRLLPLVYLYSLFDRKAVVIYNRQEVPTITAAGRLNKVTKVPYNFCFKLVNQIEAFFVRGITGVISIPLKARETGRIVKWSKPYVVVPNYPDLQGLLYSKKGELKDLKIIYSGSVGYSTGLISYLEMIRELSVIRSDLEVSLLLVGHLSGITKEQLGHMIASAKCEQLVSYQERVPYKDLQDIFQNSTVALAFADPSHVEYREMASGTSRKLFTYMSAGLPILAGGAFSEIVAEESLGFCAPYNDSSEMVVQIQKLLDDIPMARAMGKTGYDLIQSRYNWDKYVPELAEFTQRCINVKVSDIP